MHGLLLTDEYAWLREKRKIPKLPPYLDAENVYAEAVMAPPGGPSA